MSGKSPYPIVDGCKRCRCCKRPLVLDSFAKRLKQGKVYLRGACRDCQNILNQQRRIRHAEVYSNWNREYRARKYAEDPNYYRKQYRQKLLHRAGL